MPMPLANGLFQAADVLDVLMNGGAMPNGHSGQGRWRGYPTRAGSVPLGPSPLPIARYTLVKLKILAGCDRWPQVMDDRTARALQ
jgi:hypothetical protein